MDSFRQIYDRIRSVTKARTQTDLAELLGIKQSSISDAKRRNSVPADWYITLLERFDLNPLWLKTGVGRMYINSESVAISGYATASEGLAEEYAGYGSGQTNRLSTSVSVYSCNAGGEKLEDLKPSEFLNIPSRFAVNNIKVLLMNNSSMSPIIMKNAYVGINSEFKNPASGELFAIFAPHEGLTIRQVYIDFDKEHIMLQAKNDAFPKLTLSPDEFKTRVLGKVEWVLQNL